MGDKQKKNGIDYYELSWDIVSKQLGKVLLFNFGWYLLFLFLLVICSFIAYKATKSWISILVVFLVIDAVISPIWEASNILKFTSSNRGRPKIAGRIGVLVAANFFYTVFCLLGYVFLVIPGFIIRTRCFLFIPILLNERRVGPFGGLTKSWRISKGRFADLYMLRFVTTSLKTVSLLPLGVGYLIYNALSGLSKEMITDDLETE